MSYELQSIKPLIAVLVSLCVIPVLASCRSADAREGWTFAAGVVKLLICASMLPAVLAGNKIEFVVAPVLPGAPLAFSVDALGLMFALVASSLWIVTSAYSIGYMRGLREHSQTRYYSFFALALSATIGAAFSANLLTLYLFYELLSFATYPLVTHHQDEASRISGRKYLFFIVGASIGLCLPAMLICYFSAGTLDFAPQGFLNGAIPPETAGVLLFIFIFGFAKAAVMPMHSWLPAAMVAPTPVSALLHAVAVVKVGAFSILRVITGVFGVDYLAGLGLDFPLGVVASITIIAASLIALSQNELKRRLAFSTIGQLSYIVLGAALLSPKALIGAFIHVAMHAFGKITLFFCAGAVYVTAGEKYVNRMVGIGKRMPWTMTAFFIGSISVIGLPPAGGFLSKWNLLLGTLDRHEYLFLGVLLVSSLLNAAYFLPIVYKAFFYQDTEYIDMDHGEASGWLLGPILVTAGASLILFFRPGPFMELAKLAVRQVTGGEML